MLQALTLDFWDTLYEGTPPPTRKDIRRDALARLFEAVGRPLDYDELLALDRACATEAERWWREDARGYTAADRIRWMLARHGIDRPDDCELVGAAVAAVDEALIADPPPLLDGAADAVRSLAELLPLAIVSDTGFASGVAQDRLLERDGILQFFPVRAYSCDIGHAKPRPEPFLAAATGLRVEPNAILHVGDNERTDVGGALALGMRAIRLDVVRKGGPSAAEQVVGSLAQLVEAIRARM